MAEKWFCFADVKFYDEGYVPRHNKAVLWVESFDEAMELVKRYVGDNFETITFEWAGKSGQECKQDPFFSESEFYRFETIRAFIEDDWSYKDYKKAEEAYERSKQN